MEQKATVTFDVLADSSRPLVVTGELLPHTEQEHAALATLLDEKNPPAVSLDFKNVNGVLSYNLKFSKVEEVAAERVRDVSDQLPKKAAKK